MHLLKGLRMYSDADLGLWTVLAAACILWQTIMPESNLLVKLAERLCSLHKTWRWPSAAPWDSSLCVFV